jgi:lipoate-protein ligase A
MCSDRAVLFAELIQIHDPEPHPAALNMALDEVLLARCETPFLRIYRWAAPAVSFGYFGKYTEIAEGWSSRELVRRWTGGGVVPHGEDLTYTLVVPRADPFFALSALDSYRLIHEQVAVLFAEAPHVQLSTTPTAERSAACFERPSQFDVLAGEVKIAGAAQRRTRDGLLHQGSIQSMDLPADAETRLPSIFAGAITLREWRADELAAASEIAEAKYASEAWTRRW